jgi:hypothetical protein
MRWLVFYLALSALLARGEVARAEASGPDTWDVKGVRADDTLNVHERPDARSRSIAGIPSDAKGLRNLGCSGVPTFQQWSRMSEADRVRSARARWCRIEYAGVRGWVAGRFLAEGGSSTGQSGPSTIGPWTIRCASGCALVQTGIGSTRPTLLKLVRREGSNADITIERAGIARHGTLTIYMDGETITQGPTASFASGGSGRLFMPADDITIGLLRQMARHKNMVLSFPGEERGVEIHLDRFDEAWRALGQYPQQ